MFMSEPNQRFCKNHLSLFALTVALTMRTLAFIRSRKPSTRKYPGVPSQ